MADSSRLTIPDEAVRAAADEVRDGDPNLWRFEDAARAGLAAAAPLIVAAYLDEMAEMWQPSPGTPPIPHDYLIKRLRERAAELRGGVSS